MKKAISFVILCIVFSNFLVSCGVNNEKNTDFKAEFVNLEGEYIPIKDAVESSTFPEPDANNVISSLNGSGCLNDDKTSEIEIKVLNGAEAQVTIDKKSVNLYLENLYGADIVDLDKNDTFSELAIYSMGASLDPTVNFIRYDGENIIPLLWYEGEYCSSGICGYYNPEEENVLPPFSKLWTNQEGRIVTAFGSAQFTDKMMAFEYFELNQNKWEEVILPKINSLPLSTKIAADIDVYFTPSEDVPENFEDTKYFLNFDNEKVTKLKKGQNIEIIDYGKAYGYYIFYADIDGEKGVIAFWTGD